MTRFEEAAIDVIESLRQGEVLTYGEVAEEAGFPGAARAVGRLLRTCNADLPWWRVVGAGGHLVAPSATEQSRRLTEEGWIVRRRRIVR